MATLEIHGKTFEVDGDGFLTDPSIWNEDVAKLFAEADGITELNDKHWAIIKIIRDNFEEKGNAPIVRTICFYTHPARHKLPVQIIVRNNCLCVCLSHFGSFCLRTEEPEAVRSACNISMLNDHTWYLLHHTSSYN